MSPFPLSCCLRKFLKEVMKAATPTTQVTHLYTSIRVRTLTKVMHCLAPGPLNTCCHGDCCSLIGPGKQLVHYTTTPVLMSEPISLGEGGADLPSLLELEAEPFFSSDPPTDDPAAALLSHAHLDSDLWRLTSSGAGVASNVIYQSP